MLQLLVCSDVHTYVDNIRLAVHKMDRVDAILIAGDQEAEESRVLEACGDIPCYLVRGNNDYYLDTEYPQELLIDIFEDPGTSFRGPEICKRIILSLPLFPLISLIRRIPPDRYLLYLPDCFPIKKSPHHGDYHFMHIRLRGPGLSLTAS